MTASYGKRERSRRSVFGLWVPNKTNKPAGKLDPCPAESTVSDSPASDHNPGSTAGKDRLRIRLTRSGSQNSIVVWAGWLLEHVESPRLPSLSIVEHGNEISLVECLLENSSPEITSSVIALPESQEPAQEKPRPEIGVASVVPCDSEDVEKLCGNVNEPQCPLNTKLVDRLSLRVSSPFGQPTVIRRTHLRSRHSIPFIGSLILKTLMKQHGDGADDSSDPSTTPSSNGSPLGCSTPPTPVKSAEPSPSSDKFTDSPNFTSISDHVAAVSTTQGNTSRTITASIKTVEAVSVAKIYLELYYNSIFQNQDPRLQRQHELDQYIFAFQLVPGEQVQIRRNWALQENEHLRQVRALKTRMRCSRDEAAVSIAGYEVIKVLGKGSFGVVRLKVAYLFQELGLMAYSGPRWMEPKTVAKIHDWRKEGSEGHIRAERDFLVAAAKSRWVVPLITSFQDSTNLYLVMDYMLGGDFLGLLIRKDILREDRTRFYIAEMILCIEEAHRLQWIHRDIKPDNFLISASGHLKISDFGLAFNGHWAHDQTYYNSQRHYLIEKLGVDVIGDAEDQAHAAEIREFSEMSSYGVMEQPNSQVPSTDVLDWRNSRGRRRFAKSVVGTSQYMAPEVIRGEMYDGRCDWWSLGIIIFECLYGYTPFACETRHDTKIKILQHNKTLQFPREKPTDKMVSPDAIDLMARILQEREFRLCSQKYYANNVLTGRPVSAQFLYSMDSRHMNIPSYYVYPNDAADIKAHPFFRGTRWSELHLTQPPLVPRVKGWEDSRYFDDWKGPGNIDEASGDSDAPESDEDLKANPDGTTALPQGRQSPGHPPDLLAPEERPVPDTGPVEAEPFDQRQPELAQKKEKRRPRDKILRDKKAGRAALEIRKQGAFLGYTYRRPKSPALALSTDRGRQPFARGQLGNLYFS
ncbi:uncharacterized protein N7477_009477 [Penicillium maclennaniae]|uniref:uncharacterized protein n=1 Tax=Penicillium maclennaniae TaxID=1343394 RepID=UPI0025407D64|nr:uncharacterized protein N7477_009477 [Penicillium maclennaniae]KAJ5661861.1 hypothetical protein N7477_009477 [Penicillium maclennaniae]